MRADVGDRENHRVPVGDHRQRRRHPHRTDHGDHQDGLDGALLRVVELGGGGGDRPGPPDRRQHQQDHRGAGPVVDFREQGRGQRERGHEDHVEEQLQQRGPGRTVRPAYQCGGASGGHARPPAVSPRIIGGAGAVRPRIGDSRRSGKRAAGGCHGERGSVVGLPQPQARRGLPGRSGKQDVTGQPERHDRRLPAPAANRRPTAAPAAARAARQLAATASTHDTARVNRTRPTTNSVGPVMISTSHGTGVVPVGLVTTRSNEAAVLTTPASMTRWVNGASRVARLPWTRPPPTTRRRGRRRSARAAAWWQRRRAGRRAGGGRDGPG